MKTCYVRALGVVMALLAGGSLAYGDLIVRKDGSVVEGKVLARDTRALVVQPDGQTAGPNLTLAADTVVRVLVIDAKGAVVQEGAGAALPAKKPEAHFEIPPEPKAPPIVPAPEGGSYYVIPLHGVVGETVLADALEKSLADAVKRAPAVVVLDIDSPGGRVSEAEAMMKILHRYNKQLRIVALADQNLSAAAITSLSVKEIFVKSSSTTGAATAYDPVNLNLPADIKEKMQSAWRAVARNSAEEGGHEPLLAEAMIDSSRTLHLETVDGKKVVKEGPGDNLLCQKGKILTLTSHEAVSCGLAVEITDDYAELGEALKFKSWAECPGLGKALGEYLPKRWASLEQHGKDLETELRENLMAARSALPSDDVVTQRVITTPIGPQAPAGGRGGGGGRGGAGGIGSPFGGGMIQPAMPGVGQVSQSIITSRVVSAEMRAKWKDRSLATVVALQKAEQNLQDAITLAKAYGMEDDTDDLKDTISSFGSLRAEIYLNRNKYAGDAGAIAGGTPPAGAGGAGGTSAPVARPAPPWMPGQPTSVKLSPIPAKLSELVKDSTTKKTYRSGVTFGTVAGDHDFADICNDGVLVGLRCTVEKHSGKDVVISIQPLYLGNNATIAGRAYGSPAPGAVIDLVAKDGYAVGGAIFLGSPWPDTVVLRFLRITDNGLDPRDAYDSDRIGKSPGNTTSFPMGTAIGICGMTNDSSTLRAGLLFLPPTGPAGTPSPIANPALPGRGTPPSRGTPPGALPGTPTPPVAAAPGAAAPPAIAATPLTAEMGAALKLAIDKKSYKPGFIVGGAQSKDGFTSVAEDGVLVGLRCGVGKTLNSEAIVSVQPVFLTSKGVVLGPVQGSSSGARMVDLVAKDGFMVGGARVAGTNNIQGLRLKFVRLTNGAVDTKDSYESETVGTLDKPTTLSSTTPVIGITGRGGMTTSLGLGLVSLSLQ